jgi:hypothetical protein
MEYEPYYPRSYTNDQSVLFSMSPKPDSLQLGGVQDTQQYPQHELEDIWPETISPSVLSALPSYGVQIYNDEESFSNHVPISISPINVNIALATSNANHPGPSSSVSTTPNTPGLVSPSHAGYASSPSLLNVSPPTPSYNLRPDAYHPFPTSAPVSPYPSQRSPWHLSNAQSSPEPDRVVPFSEFQRGPMVPQKRYKPHTSSDRRRYVDEVDLESAIFFYMQKPDESGIPLRDALHGRFARLAGRDEPMFKERGPSISVRINWPGYQPWSRQIPTRDFRNPPGPITRSKLAKNVSKSVARFITEHNNRPMEEDGDLTWAVGPRKIEVTDLVLVRLDHVSKGSWQAHLQLLHPLRPRP